MSGIMGRESIWGGEIWGKYNGRDVERHETEEAGARVESASRANTDENGVDWGVEAGVLPSGGGMLHGCDGTGIGRRSGGSG